MDKGSFEVEKGKTVPNGTTQNTSNYVAGAVIGWQLSIGNGKSHGTHVIHDYPNGNIDFVLCFTDVFYIIFGVIVSRKLFYFFNQRCEHVCIIIGGYTLYRHTQTLESHACVHVFFG